MKSFQVWFDNNRDKLCDNTIGLFEDSIKCFKHDIYRPAYLLAYQGLMRQLRDVIVYGSRPAVFTEPEWNAILQELDVENPDKRWDDKTFDRIKQGLGGGKSPLSMPYDVRKKFEYWRDLRNVCAHYKEYLFLEAHTLTLYAFIEQNLLSITTEGGMQTFLRQLEEFYDPSRTVPGQSEIPNIERIPSMIKKSEMEVFVQEIMKIRSRYHVHHNLDYLLMCIDHLPDGYVEEIFKIVNNDYDLQERVIERRPELVLKLITEPQSIRQFWTKRLRYYSNTFIILAHMLEAGIIPQDQHPELINLYLDFLYNSGSYLPTLPPPVVETYKKFGFFQAFMSKYLDVSFTNNVQNMSKICYTTTFYTSFMHLIDISEEFVRRIIDVFCVAYPYTLRDVFEAEFTNDDAFYTKFEAKAIELGLTIPASIKKKP